MFASLFPKLYLFKKCTKIASALKNISTLKSLFLGNIIVSKETANELAVALSRSYSLECFWLPNNSIEADEMIVRIYIAESLCCLSMLKILDIGNNHITAKAISVLALVISKNRKLEEL